MKILRAVRDNRASFTLRVATALVVVALIEFLAFLAIEFILLPREPSLFFHPPAVIESKFQRYMEVRDPLLGWPARTGNAAGIEEVVSRPIPAYPVPGAECVSLYGDSFTYGDEVQDFEAWSNALSLKLGCRVANYGIGGYGTDQAYLRFSKNANDNAKLVILGVFPDNVMRNVNQYRYFLDAQTVFSLKPRFILEGNGLRLVEVPIWNYEEFLSATKNPEKAFSYETFLPDSPDGPVTPSFPYLWRAIRLLLSERVKSGLLGHTNWEVFFRSDHPTQALRITVEIADLFKNACRSRGKNCLVIIYPTGRSFKQFKRTGLIVTRPLGDGLGHRGIKYLDLHQAFSERVEEKGFCELLTRPGGCVGHFNAEGNRLVADIVYEHLTKKNLLKMGR